MPFTFSHLAAILPFRRSRHLSLLPLIAGSIAPDLQYFLPEAISSYLPNSHTLLGAFTSGPIAALVWLVLVRVLRRPLTSPLSGRHRVLVSKTLEGFGASPRDWLLALPAILVGVILHLVWDSFTHAYGWPVRQFSVLRATVSLASLHMDVFHFLQWLSSVLGLWAMVLIYRRAVLAVPAEPTPDPTAPVRFVAIVLSSLCAIGTAALRIQDLPPQYRSLYGMGYVASITAVDTFVVLYVAVGFYLLRSNVAPAP